jgi:hypothetical protein
MGDIDHVKELLETHASYMNERMDQIHAAVLDSTQMAADHEIRIQVMEKREDKATRWGALSGAIGGFLSGILSGKIG